MNVCNVSIVEGVNANEKFDRLSTLLFVPVLIAAQHASYGLGFIDGLTSRRKK